MKRYFLLVVFFLSRCSIYDLSFDGFNKFIVTEPIFNILSPKGEIITDELDLKLEIGHPDGITAIYIDGEFSDDTEHSNTPQYVIYSKKIPLQYSDTYLQEDGKYKFTVDIKTKSLEPFVTNVTLIVHRSSPDIVSISYPTEYPTDGNWTDDDLLKITASETGAGIATVLYDDDSSPAPMSIDDSPSTISSDTDTYNVSVSMKNIFPNGLHESTVKSIKYVTTSGVTNSFDIEISTPYIMKLVRDNEDTVSEWLPITIYVKDPDSYSYVYIDSPNVNKQVSISEFTNPLPLNDNSMAKIFEYKFDLAYDDSYSNPDGVSYPYTADNGNYHITLELISKDPAIVSDYTLETDITIRRKMMDKVNIDYPDTLPISGGVWTDDDKLSITADNTGDTIGTVIVSSGSLSIEFPDINVYSHDIKMSDIWFFKDATTPISASITVVPTKDVDRGNVHEEDISILKSTDTASYIELGDYTGKTFYDETCETILYPIIIKDALYEKFSDKESFQLFWGTGDKEFIGLLSSDTNNRFTDGKLMIADKTTTVYLELSASSEEDTTATARLVIKDESTVFDSITINIPRVTGDYVTVGEYTGDPWPTIEDDTTYIYYPVILSKNIRADFSQNTVYFYNGDTIIDVMKNSTASPTTYLNMTDIGTVSDTTVYLKLSYDTTYTIDIHANAKVAGTKIDTVTFTTPVDPSTKEYLSVGTYTGNPASTTEGNTTYIYYPVTVSKEVYENYNGKNYNLYFYTNDNDVAYVGTTTASMNTSYFVNSLSISGDTTLYLKLAYNPNEATTYDIQMFVGHSPSSKIGLNTVTITTPTSYTYTSLGLYTGTPAHSKSGFVWYPIKIDPALYTDYPDKTSFELYYNIGNKWIFALHDGTQQISDNSVQMSWNLSTVYIDLQAGVDNGVRIVFNDGGVVGDGTYLDIPAYSSSSTTIVDENGIKISSVTQFSETHAEGLETVDIPDGYSWYGLTLDTDEFKSTSTYISIATGPEEKSDDDSDYTVLGVTYFDNNDTITKNDKNLDVGNIKAKTRTYYIAVPSGEIELYLKETDQDNNSTYTKLN